MLKQLLCSALSGQLFDNMLNESMVKIKIRKSTLYADKNSMEFVFIRIFILSLQGNHLTGCAVDIRTNGMEQAIEYAAILIAYANESAQDYDELLIEKNRYGAVWLHFAMRPKDNRRKVAFIIVWNNNPRSVMGGDWFV